MWGDHAEGVGVLVKFMIYIKEVLDLKLCWDTCYLTEISFCGFAHLLEANADVSTSVGSQLLPLKSFTVYFSFCILLFNAIS
jgi:hypothetical protein